jgi:ribosomal-protein-alanine N-acetyltransferase
MFLETGRLRLAPLLRPDAELIFPLMNDAEVMAHWDTVEIDDPDVVEAIVAAQVADTEAGKAFYWSMRSLADQDFLGVCDLSEFDRWHHRAEIGFMLKPAAWGQGYAREAMVAVIAFAAELNIHRLAARTHVGNHRSETLLQHLGFEDEGMLRGYVLRDGERRDCRLWGLLL